VTDLTAFLRRILDDRDLAACGVLADYLEERGDARGVRLRERWRKWERERSTPGWYDRRHYDSWEDWADRRMMAHVIMHLPEYPIEHS
jgi:hypothetical protein